jgi:hypothetical protein
LEDFYVSIATLHANLMVQELLDLDWDELIFYKISLYDMNVILQVGFLS